MSAVPKEIDETAYIDGYRFLAHFFMHHLFTDDPLRHRRDGVFQFYVFLGRIVARKDIDLGGGQTDFGNYDPNGGGGWH